MGLPPAIAAAHFGVIRRRVTAYLEGTRDGLRNEVVAHSRQLRRNESYFAEARRMIDVGCWAISLGRVQAVYWSEERHGSPDYYNQPHENDRFVPFTGRSTVI